MAPDDPASEEFASDNSTLDNESSLDLAQDESSRLTPDGFVYDNSKERTSSIESMLTVGGNPRLSVFLRLDDKQILVDPYSLIHIHTMTK